MIILYDKTSGEIKQTMDFAMPERIDALRSEGWGVMELSNNPMENYIDLDDLENPVLRNRPYISADAEPSTVAILQTVKIPSVPKGKLTVTGPTSGTIDHPGGDIILSFALPGQYIIEYNNFPYRYRQWTIAVTTTAAAANAAAETQRVLV